MCVDSTNCGGACAECKAAALPIIPNGTRVYIDDYEGIIEPIGTVVRHGACGYLIAFDYPRAQRVWYRDERVIEATPAQVEAWAEWQRENERIAAMTDDEFEAWYVANGGPKGVGLSVRRRGAL